MAVLLAVIVIPLTGLGGVSVGHERGPWVRPMQWVAIAVMFMYLFLFVYWWNSGEEKIPENATGIAWIGAPFSICSPIAVRRREAAVRPLIVRSSAYNSVARLLNRHRHRSPAAFPFLWHAAFCSCIAGDRMTLFKICGMHVDTHACLCTGLCTCPNTCLHTSV